MKVKCFTNVCDILIKHILYFQIGDPAICTSVSDKLLKQYGHYVQAINYPTVARGEEKLRLAPTPHHTKPMMDQLLLDMKAIWDELGLTLKTPVCSSVSYSLIVEESIRIITW